MDDLKELLQSQHDELTRKLDEIGKKIDEAGDLAFLHWFAIISTVLLLAHAIHHW